MFGRSRTEEARRRAAASAELVAQLAADKKFRKQLLAAVGHGVSAQRRARRQVGLVATGRRLAADAELRAELSRLSRDLRDAWRRVEKKRGHPVRNSMLVLAGSGGVAVAAVPSSRRWVAARARAVARRSRLRASVVEAQVEVEVPVSTAYNQWTQFELFPQFMEGVEEVRQLDDTRLHWVVTVAGKRAEWDAKILEQHPDRQISWISEDGRTTRGTVSFEPRGPARTLVRLSISYMTEGMEAAGSLLGLDRRRVEGDLARFKQLIETRGSESGAWRGEVSAGTTQASES